MPRKTIHEFTLFIHWATEKALKVSETGEEKKAVWLPKSEIEFDERALEIGKTLVVDVPEWLAKEKGFAGF